MQPNKAASELTKEQVLILTAEFFQDQVHQFGMAALENVPTDELPQVLTEAEGKKPTQRLMAAINYLEDDGLTQKESCRTVRVHRWMALTMARSTRTARRSG